MWQQRILLWADAHRSLMLAATAATAVLVAAVALAVAVAQSSHPHTSARSSPQLPQLPRVSQHQPAAAGLSPVTSTVVSSLRSRECRTAPRGLGAASGAAGRLLVEFMAYSLGRLGAHPSFPDATASFQRAIWGMPHSPPPALAGARVTVTLTRAELTAPRIAVVRFSMRINRSGLTPFPMLVAVSLEGCRWRAGGF